MSQTNESCTRFAKLLGIEVPFLNAPMEGIATPELVAAVSEAGGLGVIPAAGLAPDEIRAFAARVKELTQKPFAVNLAVPVDAPADAAERFERFGDAVSMLLEELELPAGEGASYAERYDLEGCTRPDFFEQFDAALEVRPAAVISSFGGFREPEEEKLAELGIVNIGTATTLREAKVLRAAASHKTNSHRQYRCKRERRPRARASRLRIPRTLSSVSCPSCPPPSARRGCPSSRRAASPRPSR